MSKVIRISEEIFQRLQRISTPLVDSPGSVIERILDFYEKKHGLGQLGENSELVAESEASKDVVTQRGFEMERSGLYLAPASEKNLQSTINQSVQMSTAEKYLSDSKLSDLKQALKGSSTFRCWAMTKNSRSKFNTMQPGDIILFTLKGSGLFSYSAKVVHKLESIELGRALWSVVPGLPWDLIYFVDDLKSINIPKEKLVKAIGYDEGYVVPGIIRVNSARINEIVKQYGSVTEFVGSLSK